MNISEDYIPEKIADNIYLTDTLYLGREKFAASYFVEDSGEIAVVETNTNHAIPGILQTILNSGFELSQIKYVILTHIHLDHAGGAGLIMKELPDAELIVHPRGARHMISPEKLIESVKSVYGEEEYKNLYGEHELEEKITEARQSVIDRLIDNKLLLAEAKRKGIDTVIIT